MNTLKRLFAGSAALCVLAAGVALPPAIGTTGSANAASSSVSMEWGAVKIGGGGFVSGIVTGKEVMYARTDVGGAYRYDYAKNEWVQLMGFVTEADRGLLSVDAMCIDPNDDNTIYMLCGCAYFSAEKTVIFKSTDGGNTWEEHDVTDLIKVHGNGYGRQCGESIAVDPDNSDIIYCGGDTDGLIMSKDGGKTWGYVDSFNDLGLFTYEVKWPTWTETIEKTTVGTDYSNSNGIGTIAIQNGKVFVGVSDNTIGANIYVADVGKDNWKPLSADLPTTAFPSRINKDCDGNLLISYVGGLSFNSTGGGIYKYNISDGKVTEISPTDNSFGACVSTPDNPDELVATTCGVWSSQLWYEGAWEDENVCWGDQFYRSTDGGKTWESITPGNAKGWGQPLQADYLDDAGYSWIRNKAIHWCGALVLDPRDSDRILLTSGNGVFACDNVWDELPHYYFHPDGIEEVVVLDMVSVPGGDEFSAIGDYDGFKHDSVYESGTQHQPNMGSTAAIAYCPQNPDVMVRIAEHDTKGYYTTDGGNTWKELKVGNGGGKAAITQLKDGSYRIFKTSSTGSNISYTDNFGGSWSDCTGVKGSKTSFVLVDPDKPETVYAYTAQYNDYWGSDPNKKEPTFDDAHYVFMVSNDYGATFTSEGVCMYDQCDLANRIAYLGNGELVLGAGWYGAYLVTDYGKNIEKLDSVFYCKTIGYGAPEKSGGANTLYMYGKPQESDPEGVYRSTDSGKTWICINTDHLYGGTGNGNFLVGDMNEFGTVYMSTVGCGIIYGKLSTGTDQPSTPPVTKPTEATTTKPTSAPTSDNDAVSLWGDANCDNAVDINDAVLIMSHLANKAKYSVSDEGAANADVYQNGDGLSIGDANSIQKYLAKIIKALPES